MGGLRGLEESELLCYWGQLGRAGSARGGYWSVLVCTGRHW